MLWYALSYWCVVPLTVTAPLRPVAGGRHGIGRPYRQEAGAVQTNQRDQYQRGLFDLHRNVPIFSVDTIFIDVLWF